MHFAAQQKVANIFPVYCAVIGQIKGSSSGSSYMMCHQFLNFFIVSFIFIQKTSKLNKQITNNAF